MTLRLSCPRACGILIPLSGIEPTSSALEGGFLTPETPVKFPKECLSYGSVDFKHLLYAVVGVLHS